MAEGAASHDRPGATPFGRGPAWQRMLSGRRLDILDPAPADIDLADIAHGLARVARWNGSSTRACTRPCRVIWSTRSLCVPAATASRGVKVQRPCASATASPAGASSTYTRTGAPGGAVPEKRISPPSV